MPFGDVKKIGMLSRKDEEMREAKKALGMTDSPAEERKEKDDVNTPGSDAYLKRRQRDSEADLREADRAKRSSRY